jgi:hypothetical protein
MNKQYIKEFKVNQLERIFRKYRRHLHWNWYSLSSNPNTTCELLDEFPDEKWVWNFQGVSDNINIDLDYVNNNDKPWNLFSLSKNPSMGKYIGQPDTLEWVWPYVCYNKDVSEGILEQNRDKLDWNRLSVNHKLSWNFIEDNINKPWNWDGISTFPCINIDIVKNNLDKNWNWCSLSQNSSIKIEDIKNNPKLPWKLNSVCSNPNLTITDVLNDRTLFNNWIEITGNENMTQSVIERHPQLPWDMNVIFNSKTGLDIDFVLRYNIHNWNWHAISSSYSITFEDVLNNPTLPWTTYGLSCNPNLTLESFERFFYRLKNSISNISENLFLYDTDFYKREFKKDVQKRKIEVIHNIKDIFYNDICGEIVKYVGYN